MPSSCQMTMLWNWYDAGVCFISPSWDTSTKGRFGGSCVAVFLVVLFSQWLRRFLVEYRSAAAAVRAQEIRDKFVSGKKFREGIAGTVSSPLIEALKHKWFWKLNGDFAVSEDNFIVVYPHILDHIIICLTDTIEWSLHHVIMLLFMYFNGYVVICAWLGAVLGYFVFRRDPEIKAVGLSVSPLRCCA